MLSRLKWYRRYMGGAWVRNSLHGWQQMSEPLISNPHLTEFGMDVEDYRGLPEYRTWFTRTFYKLSGGRPMKFIEWRFNDMVVHKPVYLFEDRLGQKWLAFHKWSLSRLKYEKSKFDHRP